jgi:hypothetical protein
VLRQRDDGVAAVEFERHLLGLVEDADDGNFRRRLLD